MAEPRGKNVMVTGTPGTGKTALCARLAERSGLRHINIGDWVREKGLHTGWDEAFQCHEIDEDALCDALEETMVAGGCLVDHHGCDFFPERWFHLVVVLRADNGVLYERLHQRKYPQKKLEENIDAEIMQVCLEEAHESYQPAIVMELQSDTVEDQDRNVDRLLAWLGQAQAPRPEQGAKRSRRAA